MKSMLEEVPGVGPVIARRLLSEFGSLDGLRKAAPGDLLKVKGMTPKRAQSLAEVLAREGGTEPSAEEPHE